MIKPLFANDRDADRIYAMMQSAMLLYHLQCTIIYRCVCIWSVPRTISYLCFLPIWQFKDLYSFFLLGLARMLASSHWGSNACDQSNYSSSDFFSREHVCWYSINWQSDRLSSSDCLAVVYAIRMKTTRANLLQHFAKKDQTKILICNEDDSQSIDLTLALHEIHATSRWSASLFLHYGLHVFTAMQTRQVRAFMKSVIATRQLTADRCSEGKHELGTFSMLLDRL